MAKLISEPMIMPLLNGYEFSWGQGKEEVLNIKVERVKSVGDAIWAEISVEHEFEEHHPRLRRIRINLLTKRGRNDIAKRIQELNLPIELNWNDLIEQVCNEVIERVRQGEPVQELWTSDDVPPLEYLLEPIIIKGVPTIIFGEKGVTKSTLTLILYLCLTLPWHDNPLGFIAPKRSIKTLVLDYELPGYIAQRNAKKIQEGMGLGPVPLYHRHCSAPLADEVEQVASHITKLGAEVVIIDSLARACGGELNKTEPANNFFEAIDKLNVTSLIIAQTSKDVEAKRKTIYGNALFTYYARSIWELCKSETLQDDIIDIALFHRYANLTKLHSDMGFRINFNEQHTTIERQSVNIAEFIGKVNTQKAILDELKSGALTVKELAEKIGRKPDQVSPLLTKLKKKNLVVNLPGDMWGLCQQGL